MPLDFEMVGEKGNAGMNIVRSVGEQIRLFPVLIDFSGVEDYSGDGEEVDFDSYFQVDTITVIIKDIIVDGAGAFTGDFAVLSYDEDDKKIHVYDSANGTEMSENDDISSLGKIRAIAYGY